VARNCAVILTLLLIVLPVAAEERKPALDGIDVLLVTPAKARKETAWIAPLVTKHGAKVESVDWKAATPNRTVKFDLVIVAGKGRNVGGSVVTDFRVPVLGVGVYGHNWFGRSRLKHGHPHS
jgi:hypothetical protein